MISHQLYTKEKRGSMTDNTECGDNRFEIIQHAKNKLIESTNIESSPEEMKVLDNILFRMWQMGWLPDIETKTISVVHAHWEAKYNPEELSSDTLCKCSNCREEEPICFISDWNFCPHCGAKMDYII